MEKCAVKNCERKAKYLIPLPKGFIPLCTFHADHITELTFEDLRIPIHHSHNMK